MSLTATQRDALGVIERHVANHGGVPPTVREIGLAIGLRSTSGAHRIVLALEERGFIRRHRDRARGIAVVKQADAAGRAVHDLTPELLAMLESIMWSASSDLQEGDFAPGCSLCGAERPSDPSVLCSCRLGRMVRQGRAAVGQAGRAG